MRPRLLLLLVPVLVAVGSAAVIAATAPKTPFTLRIDPGSQSVSQGGVAIYGIGIDRSGSFTRQVKLSVSGLPSTITGTIVKGVVNGLAPTGMTPAIRARRTRCYAVARRKPTAGARRRARAKCVAVANKRAAVPKLVPLAPSTPLRLRRTTMAALYLQTDQGAVTPPGTYGFTITGTAANGTVATVNGTLVVLRAVAGAPGFSLSITPAEQTVVQSDDAAFDVSVPRSGGFTGPVSLSAPGLPDGVTASFSTSTVQGAAGAVMTLTTAPGLKIGTYSAYVVATGTAGGVPLTRLASTRLLVEENRRFTIAGDVPGLLGPGAARPLDLAVTNPHRFTIAVRDLTVALDPATDRAQCSATDNFTVEQIPAGGFPIVVPAGATRRLTEGGLAAQSLPRITMRNLPTNQDACMGARLQLRYSGNATKP